MGINLITVNCPACGAELSTDREREFSFCTYCGTKVMLNKNNEFVYRNIDEARIKEAETDRMLRLKELEIEEKTGIPRKKLIYIWIAATAALVLIGVLGSAFGNDSAMICLMFAMLVGIMGYMEFMSNGSSSKSVNRKPRRVAGENEVMITSAMEDYYGKNFNNAVLLYKSAGFINVTAIPLEDLSMLNREENGKVDTITINGNDEFEEGDIFLKNANILITYHSR